MIFPQQPHQLIDLESVSEYPFTVNFFPIYRPNPSLVAHLDTEIRFEQNLKKQSSDWYYRHNSVTYTINSQQYRCNDFKKIDWENSIVILGCSNVFGTGVDDKDTISSRLQELVGLNVVNLGTGATSQQFSLYNMILLKKHNIKPKAIIHVWTHSNRLMLVDNNDIQRHGGPWNNWGLHSKYQYGFTFSDYKTHIFNFKYNRIITDLLYNDIPMIHASFYEEDVNEQNDPNLIHLSKIDYARDMTHPGIESFKNAAKILYDKLKNWYPTSESNGEHSSF